MTKEEGIEVVNKVRNWLISCEDKEMEIVQCTYVCLIGNKRKEYRKPRGEVLNYGFGFLPLDTQPNPIAFMYDYKTRKLIVSIGWYDDKIIEAKDYEDAHDIINEYIACNYD